MLGRPNPRRPSPDDLYAQRQRHSEGHGASGLARTLTCALVSAPAAPCIDVVPVPAHTNEMGAFPEAVRSLKAAYGRSRMLEMVTSDAGLCSLENAGEVRRAGWHHLFAIEASQPTLLAEARGLLASRNAELRLQPAGGPALVRAVALPGPPPLAGGDRLPPHLGHRLCEDDRPWIRADPKAAVGVMVLRRLAYNLLTLFRSVTQRSEEKRGMPWKALMEWLRTTLVAAQPQDLAGLRAREALPTEA